MIKINGFNVNPGQVGLAPRHVQGKETNKSRDAQGFDSFFNQALNRNNAKKSMEAPTESSMERPKSSIKKSTVMTGKPADRQDYRDSISSESSFNVKKQSNNNAGTAEKDLNNITDEKAASVLYLTKPVQTGLAELSSTPVNIEESAMAVPVLSKEISLDSFFYISYGSTGVASKNEQLNNPLLSTGLFNGQQFVDMDNLNGPIDKGQASEELMRNLIPGINSKEDILLTPKGLIESVKNQEYCNVQVKPNNAQVKLDISGAQENQEFEAPNEALQFFSNEKSSNSRLSGNEQQFLQFGGKNATLVTESIDEKSVTSLDFRQVLHDAGKVPLGEKPEVSANNRMELIHKLVEHVNLISRQGGKEMVIHLKPDHLGKMHLQVSVDEGVVTAKFTAESHIVKQIIESSLPQLRQSLSEQGMKFDKVQVEVQNGTHSFTGQQGHNQDSQQQHMPKYKISGKFSTVDATYAADKAGLVESGNLSQVLLSADTTVEYVA